MAGPGRRSIICAAALALVAGAHAQSRVTLDALLSAPFPSEIAPAPAGGRVAWVENARGARNVWIASSPDFTPRRLTSYSGDDGQEISSLAWSPDGRVVLYVRGGSPNRQGETPNPALSPQPPEQAIFAVEVGGANAAPRRLATGSSPAVSGSGQVAYLSRGQVWTVDLAGTGAPAQLFTIRGSARDLRWSPDGTRLAFVSARGDHSFVGIYDVKAKSLRYIDPSIDLDGNPSWSPDGTRLAFTRIPATRENLMFAPRREGLPWSIRVARVETGDSREVWRAEPGAGSVFQGLSARDQLMWGSGDVIVFPWERDGWLHLYSVPDGGGRPTLLTPGAFEVEHAALSPDRTRVVYSSNQDDPHRRHLWSVPVDGRAPPSPVTRGSGAEWMPAPVDDTTVVYFASTGRVPAHVRVHRENETDRALQPLAARTPAFPADALIEPQPVTITAADGMEIPAQIFLPRDLAPGEKRPAVIFFHGGSRRQMLLAWHYLAYYHNTYALNQYLASRGYVVLSVNYRSGTGYGLEFREALNYGATGASEFQDVIGAGLYLKSRPDVDPDRIGVYGGSYGGYLTAHALARASDLFAAGVDIHGVHDWNVGIRTFRPDFDPEPDIARRNFLASPLAYVDGWRSPVLLIHGDDDRNVAFSETVTLAEQLRRRGVEIETLVLPDEVHGFLRHDSWLRVLEAAAEFFDRRLKGSEATSSAR